MLLINFLLFVVLSAASVVQAKVDITSVLVQIPKCSLSCASIIVDGGCSLNEQLPACLCTNNTMQFDLGSCLLNACNTTDVAAASTLFQNEVCIGFSKESRSKEIITCTIVLATLTGVFVIARIVSRRMVTTIISWDDWAFIVATILLIPTITIVGFNASRGFGQHFWDVPPQNILILRKLYYVSQILYVLNLASSKFSILFLYRRVFNSSRFRLVLTIVMIWMVLHHLAFTAAVIFSCDPIKRVWEPSVPGRCLNSQAIIYSGAVLNIIEDFVIMFLPVSELRGLKLNTKKKVGLAVLFASGSLACITSIVRLKYIMVYGNTLDSTWDNVNTILWSTIELYTALICACLVCLRPLVVRLVPCMKSLNSTAASRETPATDESRLMRARIAAKLRGGGNGIRLSDTDPQSGTFDTDIKSPSGRRGGKEEAYASNTELVQMGTDKDMEAGRRMDDSMLDDARPFDASQSRN